jgi:hypothetical protein
MATCNYQNEQEYCDCNNKVLGDYNYCQLHIEHQQPQIVRKIEECYLCTKSFNFIDKLFKRYKVLQCGCIFHKKCIYKNIQCNTTNPCTCPICKKYCYIPDLILTDYQISRLLFQKKMQYHTLFKNTMRDEYHTTFDCEDWIRSIQASCMLSTNKKTQKQVNTMIAYNDSAFEYMLNVVKNNLGQINFKNEI